LSNHVSHGRVLAHNHKIFIVFHLQTSAETALSGVKEGSFSMKIKVVDPKQISDFPSFLLNSQVAMIRKTAAFSLTAQFEAPMKIGRWTYTDLPCIAMCMLYQNWEAKSKPQWVFSHVTGLLVNAKTSKFEFIELPAEISTTLLKSLNKFLKKKMIVVKTDDFLEKVAFEKQEILKELNTILGSLQTQGGALAGSSNPSFVDLETTQAEAARIIAEAEAMRDQAQREKVAAQREADQILSRAREQTAELMTLAQMQAQNSPNTSEEMASIAAMAPAISEVLEQSQRGHESSSLSVGKTQTSIPEVPTTKAREESKPSEKPPGSSSKSKLPLFAGIGVLVVLIAAATVYFMRPQKKTNPPLSRYVNFVGNTPVRELPVRRPRGFAIPNNPVANALKTTKATLGHVMLHLSFDSDRKSRVSNPTVKLSGLKTGEGVDGKGLEFAGLPRAYAHVKTSASNPQQTYEFWFKSEQKGKAGLFALQTGADETSSWRSRFFFNDRALCFEHRGKKRRMLCSKSFFKLNQWNHVAVTLDTNAQKAVMFLNGKKEKEGAIQKNGSKGELYLGIASGKPAFKGVLDEFTIHNKALTAAQIKLQGSRKTSLLLNNRYRKTYQQIQNALFATRMKPLFSSIKLNSQILVLHFDKETKNSNVKMVQTRQVKGISREALGFDGRRSYVQLRLEDVPKQQTLEFWFKPTGQQKKAGLFSYQNKPHKASWQLQVNYKGDSVCLNYYDNEARFVCGKTRLSLETWHHVAVTIDTRNNKSTLYINGREEGSFSMRRFNLQNDIFLGVSQYGSFFKGEIDEVAIYSSVLPASQLKVHATRNSPILRGSGYDRYIQVVNAKQWLSLKRDIMVELHGDKPSPRGSTLKKAFKNEDVKRSPGISKEGFSFGKSSLLAMRDDFDQPKLTMEFWMKTPQRLKAGGLLALETRKTKKNSATKMMLDFNGNDVCFTVFVKKSYEACTKQRYKPDTWYHVAVVIDLHQSGTVELYLNGQKKKSMTFGKTQFWGELYVGSSLSSGVFQGTLDEIVVFKRALTSSQIARHATRRSPVFRP
jgi:hypothetical protein